MSSTLASEMRVIEITEPGDADVLRLSTRPVPRPGHGEVLLAVAAAGVNRPDIMQRKGLYPPPSGASDIPGLEVAGQVVALGEDVTNPQLGDAVCALVTGGGYAEYCRADAALCLPVPEGISLSAAAGLPETYFTVWSNVFQRGALRAGETLLVHGGTGGIGTTAIQLGKAFGATVYTTCGSQDKCAFCVLLGADAAINYRTEDFVTRVQELTGQRGVDIILDLVGGPYLQKNLASLANDGRVMLIAVQGGTKSEINLLPLLLKRATLTGSTLRPRSVAEKAGIAKELRAQVWPLLATQRLRPIIHAVLPLTQAAEAHRIIEAGLHRGKIILHMCNSA